MHILPSLAACRVLLLSAYDAASHRLWRENLLAMFPEIEWTILTLPPRHFAWRVRGNSLSWAFNHHSILTDNYDLLITTSMTDLSALRGFVPALGVLPTAVYFHENQFAYPSSQHQSQSVEPQVLNLYTALCADELVFNSDWNRSTFLTGCQTLLKKFPDHVPRDIMDRLARSHVLPVPLEPALFEGTHLPLQRRDDPVLSILWNHRWEYDKGPDLLLAIVQCMIQRRLRFRLHLLGERFRTAPEAFREIQVLLANWYLEQDISPGVVVYVQNREDYRALLRSADVALSTAWHDFQGLSLQEACASGCSPLAPDRLVYPEYLPPACLYDSSQDITQSAAAAVAALERLASLKQAGMALPSCGMQSFSPTALRAPYHALLASLLARPDAPQAGSVRKPLSDRDDHG